MTDPDLLAALLAERQDCRWFPTPQKTAGDLNVCRDDEMTCRRRLRALVGDFHRAEAHLWTSDYRRCHAAQDNLNGPEGARTPESPALDQHPA